MYKLISIMAWIAFISAFAFAGLFIVIFARMELIGRDHVIYSRVAFPHFQLLSYDPLAGSIDFKAGENFASIFTQPEYKVVIERLPHFPPVTRLHVVTHEKGKPAVILTDLWTWKIPISLISLILFIACFITSMLPPVRHVLSRIFAKYFFSRFIVSRGFEVTLPIEATRDSNQPKGMS